MGNPTVVDKIELFFSQYKSISFAKGHSLYMPGERVQFIYYLRRGAVKMYSISPEGDEIILQVFRAGSYFPVMLLLSDVENEYGFEVVEDMEGWMAPCGVVKEFVQNDMEVISDLTRRFASALVGMSKRMVGIVFGDAYFRVVSLLLYLAEKYGDTANDGVVIRLVLSHEDIASWVGVRRETISRQIEKLQDKGILSQHERHIVISSVDTLRNELKL